MTRPDPMQRARADARRRAFNAARRDIRTARRLRENLKLAGAIAVLAAAAVLVVLGLYYGVKAHQSHVTRCHDAGGRVSHHTTYHHDSNGHTDSDTTYYCFTDHGQIDQW